jgi:hypothetical protein
MSFFPTISLSLYLFVLTISLFSLAVFPYMVHVPLSQPYFLSMPLSIFVMRIYLDFNIIRETFPISVLLYTKKKKNL